MTPSMYVVCSAHICQGLRGWAGAEGGAAGYKEDGGEKRRAQERVCVCVCVCFLRTPAVTENPNTLYLLWKN